MPSVPFGFRGLTTAVLVGRRATRCACQSLFLNAKVGVPPGRKLRRGCPHRGLAASRAFFPLGVERNNFFEHVMGLAGKLVNGNWITLLSENLKNGWHTNDCPRAKTKIKTGGMGSVISEIQRLPLPRELIAAAFDISGRL
jgi:hypothetical protein